MKGKGRPLTGVTPQRHANVLEYLPHHHREYAGGQKETVTIAGHSRDAPDPPQNNAKETDHNAAADHSKLLTDCRKREVGKLHGDIFSIGERPIEITLAKDSPRGNSTFGKTNLQHNLLQIFVERVLIEPCIKSTQLIPESWDCDY